MKKIFVSTGLAAISAAGLQSVLADTSDIISPKAWSVSGTLRGFYDDNYNLANTKRGSWGVEVDPNISYNLPLQQTDMGVRVNYGIYYYDDRRQVVGWSHSYDQEVQADLWLNHAINERWKINFTDTVAYGFNPLLASGIGAGVTTYRVNGNNLANHANLSLDTQWTKEFGTSLTYGNDFYDYQNKGTTTSSLAVPPEFTSPPLPQKSPLMAGSPGWSQLSSGGASLAGLLNRVDQNVGLDLTWTLSPETMFLAGYNFSWSSYLGNEPILIRNYVNGFTPVIGLAGTPPTPTIVGYAPNGARNYVYRSNSRDGASHEAHVGINEQLTANLTLAATVGVAYSANDKDPFQHTVDISPTANISLSYNYLPGSYVQLGLTQGQNATDQVGSGGGPTQYQNSTVVYADINHQIVKNLFATVIGRYSYSVFKGGGLNNSADQEIDASVNVTYTFNRHFSADAGYNFNDLISDLTGRPFTRNEVYLGVTASY